MIEGQCAFAMLTGVACARGGMDDLFRRFHQGRSVRTIVLLFCSNVFMTFAWYGHLKNLQHRPLIVAILVSWGIAFFEYSLQVPANRIGYQTFTLAQLKIIQEIITMIVFAAFAYWYMGKPITWNYAGAALCIIGAAFFIFRQPV
jgi:uncharacterized protein (DUF486 family)